MAKQIFQGYSDAGHGWLKVPVKLLDRMKISGRITSYSYRKGDYAYLEEDADATLFFNTYKKMFGKEPQVNFHHTDSDSIIRTYPSFNTNKERLMRKFGELK